jgi:hypothetical protein
MAVCANIDDSTTAAHQSAFQSETARAPRLLGDRRLRLHGPPKVALSQRFHYLPLYIFHDLKHDCSQFPIVYGCDARPRFAMRDLVPNSQESINLSFVLRELVMRKTQPVEDLPQHHWLQVRLGIDEIIRDRNGEAVELN